MVEVTNDNMTDRRDSLEEIPLDDEVKEEEEFRPSTMETVLAARPKRRVKQTPKPPPLPPITELQRPTTQMKLQQARKLIPKRERRLSRTYSHPDIGPRPSTAQIILNSQKDMVAPHDGKPGVIGGSKASESVVIEHDSKGETLYMKDGGVESLVLDVRSLPSTSKAVIPLEQVAQQTSANNQATKKPGYKKYINMIYNPKKNNKVEQL